MLVKICGATSAADVAALAAAGVDFVGLWHGVRGGHAELSVEALGSLAAAATAAGPEPVLVTLESGVAAVRAAVERSGVRWVQLHGYQQPGMVRALLAACPEVAVLKVLHVRGDECVERGLLPAYERAGVRMFLLDTLGADGRIGSTAVPVDAAVAADVLAAATVPVMLAGGLTADNADRFRPLPGLAGIDVDTGARDAVGRIDAAKVAAIKRAWTAQTI
ncbi:hypothetical protein [Actinokineospora sp. HUAS TT18]|uniref:phosphoribosylanthranilate isomerase n=1 Tax=Actinokineospora sp. HUAS TT18 TaxID=3447451 RepID=UPI003F523143